MTEINEVLEERGNKYGTIEDNARITMGLWDIMNQAPNADKLTDVQRLCNFMILHKIGRMVCGDPKYLDNVVDIIGYSTLMKESMEAK
jgi:hypothetical protein